LPLPLYAQKLRPYIFQLQEASLPDPLIRSSAPGPHWELRRRPPL